MDRLHFALEQVAFHKIFLRERREHGGIVFVEADAVHSLCRHCEPFVRVLVAVHDEQVINVGVLRDPLFVLFVVLFVVFQRLVDLLLNLGLELFVHLRLKRIHLFLFRHFRLVTLRIEGVLRQHGRFHERGLLRRLQLRDLGLQTIRLFEWRIDLAVLRRSGRERQASPGRLLTRNHRRRGHCAVPSLQLGQERHDRRFVFLRDRQGDFLRFAFELPPAFDGAIKIKDCRINDSVLMMNRTVDPQILDAAAP